MLRGSGLVGSALFLETTRLFTNLCVVVTLEEPGDEKDRFVRGHGYFRGLLNEWAKIVKMLVMSEVHPTSIVPLEKYDWGYTVVWMYTVLSNTIRENM